jgi:2-hydroxy-6-oxonona-2,4-dienedioate hydrolase
VSIYRDDEGRRKMASWYDHFLGQLRRPVSFVTVPTAWGDTNVLCTGPEGAPPLLCLHGAMGSAPSALSQCQALADDFRVVFPDTVGQPGRSAETYLPIRGHAYGRWAAEVLDGLDLPRARVLGGSMGGFIALDLARQAPERVEALALWVPGGIANTGLADAVGLGLASLGCYLWPNPGRMRRLYDRIFTDYDAAWFGMFSDGFANVRIDRRMPQLAKVGDFDALEAPVLVLAHERDQLFPAEAVVARARALFPSLAAAEVVPGMMHVTPIAGAAGEAEVARLTAFLRDPAAARGAA